MSDSSASDSRQALLRELSIDRDDGKAAGGGAGGVSPALAVVLALLAGGIGAGATWWLSREAPPVEVEVAEVRQRGGDAQGRRSNPDDSVLDATGYVTARRQATVSSEVTGRVVEVLVEEGMVVEEGQLLARLDDTLLAASVDLAAAQLDASRAALEETLAQLREAERNLSRFQDLQSRGLASDQELDAALADQDTLTARLQRQRRDIIVAERGLDVQRRQLDDMRILAPFAGVVIDKAAQPGEMISPVSAGGGFTRTGICTIVDMDSLEVEVDVNESYINRVSAGQPVLATLNSYPDWKIPAEVITIIPSADRNRATVRVRIRLLERDQRILPDMGVKVAFLSDQPPPTEREADGQEAEGLVAGLYVPASAVYRRGTEAIAFVAGRGSAQPRIISVGETRGTERRVLAGLSEGEQVVTGITEELARSLQQGASVVVR